MSEDFSDYAPSDSFAEEFLEPDEIAGDPGGGEASIPGVSSEEKVEGSRREKRSSGVKGERVGKGEKKEVVLTLKMSRENVEGLKKRAWASGMPMASYVRRLIEADEVRRPFYPVLPNERYRFYQEIAAIRMWLSEMLQKVGPSGMSPYLSAGFERLDRNYRILQQLIIGVLPEETAKVLAIELAKKQQSVVEGESEGGSVEEEDPDEGDEGVVVVSDEEDPIGLPMIQDPASDLSRIASMMDFQRREGAGQRREGGIRDDREDYFGE